MRIAITGAAGEIGRAMIEELSASHELRLLDRVRMGDPRSRVVDEGFHVLYGASAQPTNPYDLTYTRTLLAWSPEQRP